MSRWTSMQLARCCRPWGWPRPPRNRSTGGGRGELGLSPGDLRGLHGRDAGAVDAVLFEAPACRLEDALSGGPLLVLAVAHLTLVLRAYDDIMIVMQPSAHEERICARCWSSPITIVTRGLLTLHGLNACADPVRA